jgi:hypothetical protein
MAKSKYTNKLDALEECKRDFEAQLSALICDTMNGYDHVLSIQAIAFIIVDRLDNAKKCL